MSEEGSMANESKGFCCMCGTSLSAQNVHDVRGVLYCETCLAQAVTKPAPAATGGGGTSNPALAAMLGFVPGLGAVYNGEYVKALLHVLIFGGLISLVSSGRAGDFTPMFGIMIPAFIVYMSVEAYHTAKAKMLGQPAPNPLAQLGTGQPVGAILLILLGGLFLLNNFGMVPLHRILNFWPVILIAVGILMLRKRLGN